MHIGKANAAKTHFIRGRAEEFRGMKRTRPRAHMIAHET